MLNGAAEFEKDYSKAVHAIQNEFYVDACVIGVVIDKEAITLGQEIEFVLTKWSTYA